MNKRLTLVLNGKGGVGKSFFAVNLVQYFKDRQIAHVAIDSDNENSTLMRFHPDAEFLDIAAPRALDAIFHALERAPIVVADCRAASTDLFFDYFRSIDLKTVASDLRVGVTIAMPVNHEPDSVEQLQRVVEEMADGARYIVIRNAVHHDRFQLFDDSAVRVRLIQELGAKEISLARMDPWLVDALNAENLSVTEAARKLHILDRQRLLIWQRGLYVQLDGCNELLLPDKNGH